MHRARAFFVCAWLLCLAMAPLPRAAAAAPVPAHPASEWAAPWDTLSGPLDVPNFLAAAMVHDPVRHRMIALVSGDPTQLWTMPLPTTGPLGWTQLHLRGPMPPAWGWSGGVYDSMRDRILICASPAVDTLPAEIWALSLAGEPRWSAVATLGTPPPRDRNYAVILDTRRDRLVLFGGHADYATQVSDLWELSLSDPPTWAGLSPLYHPPWPRDYGSAVYDPWFDRMIFFGGWNEDLGGGRGAYLYNDTWALDFSEPQGWWPLNYAQGPGGRALQTAVVDTEHRWMVMEGGQNGIHSVGMPPLDDAWALSLDERPQWTPLPLASRTAGVYQAAYSPERGSDIVFSGNWAGFYQLNLRTPAWSQILPAIPDTFPVRQGHATLLVDRETGRLLMFAGGGSGDLWSFSLADASGWRPEPSAGHGPYSTPGMTVYDSRRNRLIAFDGGAFGNSDANLDEVWELPLDRAHPWSSVSATGPYPPARVYFSAVYDSTRDRVLLFGGLYFTDPGDRASVLDDLWELSLGDSPHWRQLTAFGTPGARYLHTAIYDAKRDRMLVYGGDQIGYRVLHDTWALPLRGDSLAWALVNTEPIEPGEALRAVLDPLRDRLLVVTADMVTRELSLADPTAWRQVEVPGKPPLPRTAPGVTFDAVHDQLLLFGGGIRSDLYALPFSAAHVTLASVESDSDRVTLSWSGMFPGEPVEVQRAEADSVWGTLAAPTADAAGHVAYEDRDFVPGRRYGYRLAVPGSTRHYGETWVTAPGQPTFGFRGAIPNPARHGLTVAFTLTNAPGARLEVYDLAGRRVVTRDLSGLVPGPYRLTVDVGGLPPGVYLLRLVQGPHAATARAVVLR